MNHSPVLPCPSDASSEDQDTPVSQDNIVCQTPPTSVEAYLRWVKRQARQLPDVYVAKRRPPTRTKSLLSETTTTTTNVTLALSNEPACLPPPTHIAPQESWRLSFAEQFISLQSRFQRTFTAWKDDPDWTSFPDSIHPTFTQLRTKRNQDAWHHFLYGMPHAKGPSEALAAGAITSSGNNLRCMLFELDQGMVMYLILCHEVWLRTLQISPDQCHWLFALLVRLHPLLVADDVFILRTLCRTCAQLRSQLDNPQDPRVAALNVLITIIAKGFGQGDMY
ncbi:gem (nuclear organelle) associated protein 2 [Dispira simplex]|nr:gem (nuclear organelle) associated protein 2 [Dispira simplex]